MPLSITGNCYYDVSATVISIAKKRRLSVEKATTRSQLSYHRIGLLMMMMMMGTERAHFRLLTAPSLQSLRGATQIA